MYCYSCTFLGDVEEMNVVTPPPPPRLALPSLSAQESLWAKISYYIVFRFTDTFKYHHKLRLTYSGAVLGFDYMSVSCFGRFKLAASACFNVTGYEPYVTGDQPKILFLFFHPYNLIIWRM
jgi:hypothetical protein